MPEANASSESACPGLAASSGAGGGLGVSAPFFTGVRSGTSAVSTRIGGSSRSDDSSGSGDCGSGSADGSGRSASWTKKVDFGDVNDFDFGLSNFAVSFWVKSNDEDDAGFVNKSPCCGSYDGIYLYNSPSQNSYSWYGPTNVNFDENGSDGEWHHLVAVREGTDSLATDAANVLRPGAETPRVVWLWVA